MTDKKQNRGKLERMLNDMKEQVETPKNEKELEALRRKIGELEEEIKETKETEESYQDLDSRKEEVYSRADDVIGLCNRNLEAISSTDEMLTTGFYELDQRGKDIVNKYLGKVPEIKEYIETKAEELRDLQSKIESASTKMRLDSYEKQIDKHESDVSSKASEYNVISSKWNETGLDELKYHLICTNKANFGVAENTKQLGRAFKRGWTNLFGEFK
jgi:DNA repair ATPase RecN